MRRREFIAGLVVTATMRRAQAQQPAKVYRLAFVSVSPVTEMTEAGGVPAYRALYEELRRLGYVEGQNLLVERYSDDGHTERLAELARDVVRREPNLILGVGAPIALAFKAATATIPIVGITGDPIRQGIVASLARPDGNITGASVDPGLEIWGKRLELLREASPKVSKVGVVGTLQAEVVYRATREAVQSAGLYPVGPPIDAPLSAAEYRRFFTAMAQEGADALIVHDHIANWTNRQLIIELANENRLPAIYPWQEVVRLGGLMAYGIDLADLGRRAADQIDQIFKGTKPGEMPYYQPTTFKLSINLKTAKTLGLTIPLSLLASADEVIE
jgi:putative tryptophan/tyrosine transport system substrate-binding protein